MTTDDVMNSDDDMSTDDMNMPMMNPGSEDDFERLLRRQLQAGQAYLPDAGFSASVLAALPARPRSRWREFLLIGVPVALISLLVLGQLPWMDWAYIARALLSQTTTMTWIHIGAGASALISLSVFAWYWRAVEET